MRKLLLEAYLATFAVLIFSTATTAFAQFPGMEEVSGTYSNSDAGVTIMFPDGWTGLASENANGTIVFTSPGGMMDSEQGAVTAITLTIFDKSKVTEPPTDPGTVGQDEAPDCETPSFTSRTVSGKSGYETTIECTNSDGESFKMRIVAAESNENWIMVGLVAPTSEFDANVSPFDSAVGSLQIQGAIDATLPTMPSDDGEDEMESSDMSVMVAGESINVGVESASTISAFELDEASKTLSFTADGSGDMTVVSVGSVLEGPYTVMVDGAAVTDFESSTDDSGVASVSVPHSSGSHEITITGTQVVPEFPIAMLAILAGVIAAATFAGRTRLLKGRI